MHDTIIILKSKKRLLVVSLVFSLLFSLAFVVGHSMYTSNDISYLYSPNTSCVRSVITFISLIIIFTVITAFLFHSLSAYSHKKSFCYSKKTFFCLWITFFLCWIPAYIAYFPGIWSYDINVQIWQIPYHYNTYHPPLQTFILQCFLELCNYSYSEALSLYALFQMVFLSFIFSYATCYFIKKQVPRFLTIVTVIFYAFNPVLAIFSLIPVKDVLCGGILIVLSLTLFDIIQSAKNNSISRLCVKFIIFLYLFCLLRNNSIYAVVVAFPFFVIFSKNKKLQIISCLLISILLYIVTTSVIYPKLGIEKASGSEILSVPLQQISNVIATNSDSLSSDDIDAISRFLPYDQIREIYNPRFADPVRFVYDSSLGTVFVLKEWLHLLPNHMLEYINAFLSLNLPMWYPAAYANDPISGVQYIETNVSIHNVSAPFVNANLSPTLLRFYEGVATYSLFEKMPQLLNIFTLSFPLWLLLFCIFFIIYTRQYNRILVFLIPLLFWATYLLCPVSSLRYILPIIMLHPLFLCLIVQPTGDFNEKNAI